MTVNDMAFIPSFFLISQLVQTLLRGHTHTHTHTQILRQHNATKSTNKKYYYTDKHEFVN
jgi:hypothetical protein